MPESADFGLNVSPIIRNGAGEGTQMKKVKPHMYSVLQQNCFHLEYISPKSYKTEL